MKTITILLMFAVMFLISSACNQDLGTKNIENDTSKKKDDKPLNGLKIDIKECKRVNNDCIGIYLKLENKSDSPVFPDSFTAKDDKNKVLTREFYINEELDKIDLVNLIELPIDSFFDGAIFYRTKEKKITLIYRDILDNRQQFKMEVRE